MILAKPRILSAMRLAAVWPDLLALLAYCGVTALFFWRIVGRGMVPSDYDLLTYFYPYKAYLAEMVHRGQLPLWNPSIFMGAPLLANVQVAALYPPDLLFYLLPVPDALRYSVVLHVFLGATFTHLFGRLSLRLSPPAAWVAGAVFAFSGYLGAQTGHLNQLHAAVWLPLLLLCLERAATKRSAAAAAAGAATLAVQMLAGHTQQLYYSGWTLVLFALFVALSGGLRGRNRLLPFAALTFMVAAGAAVAGVQLLPTLELARESYRSGGIPFSEATNFSVRLPKLMDSVLPLYNAVPYVEFIGYTGVISLVLLPAAVAGRRRPAYQWLFAGLAGVALLLALGDGTRVYGWLYRTVPGFDLFRAPARWLFLYSFSVAALCGMAVQSLREPFSEGALRRWLGGYGLALGAGVAFLAGLRLWLGTQGQEFELPAPRIVLSWWLFAGAAVAVSVAVRSWPRSRAVVGLLMGLLLLELFMAREPLEYNTPTLASIYTEPRPLYSKLEGVPPSRVLSLAKDRFTLADEGLLRSDLSRSLGKAAVDGYLGSTRLKEALAPNLAMSFGLSDLDGYDGGLLPTRRYAQLKQSILGAKEYKPDLTMQSQAEAAPPSRLLGALGVGYLVVDSSLEVQDPGWEEMRGIGEGSVRVLRNRQALPRAYLVHSVEVLPEDQRQLEAVRSLDLRQVVVLGERVDYQAPPVPGRDQVEMIGDRPGAVEVAASLEQPGFLVLSDSYYPGWKAYMDGREVPLLRADYALRAVQLDAGSHRVRFSYEPDSFRLGLALSALGLLAVAGALLLPRWIDSLRSFP